MIDTNFAQVGIYDARCLAPGCSVVIRVPVNAHQRIAPSVEDSTIVTEPDLTNAWKHYVDDHGGTPPDVALTPITARSAAPEGEPRMSTITASSLIRGASSLAPKLIAFLASGGLTVALLAVLTGPFGFTIPAEVGVILVGGISSLAAFIRRDSLLSLAPGQFSLKVIAFILTSVSATTIVVFAGAFGIDLTPWTVYIGIGVTVLGGIFGYSKSDVSTSYVPKHAA